MASFTFEGAQPLLVPADRVRRARERSQAAELVDAEALARDLAVAVRGEVRFRQGDRALYAFDASNYRQLPIGVVIPREQQDIEAAVAVCRRHGAPLLMRGGGTSLAGQCCNVAVVLDTSKHVHGILELDPVRRHARVLPGTVLDTLRTAANRHDLTFGPDPATHNHCTLGGMIGNNSCGVHAVMAGRTADNVDELEILTYRGERMRVGATSPEQLEAIIRAGGPQGQIYERLRALRDRYADLIRRRYPQIPRRVSGYNLDELLPEKGFQVARALVGSEGTCVTVLEAKLRLVPWPPARCLLVIGYRDVFAAADAVTSVMEHSPQGLEAIDHLLIEHMKKKGLHAGYLRFLPEGHAFLLAEFGGNSAQEARDKAEMAAAAVRAAHEAPHLEIVDDPDEQEKIWKVRESGLGATARVPGEPDAWPGWEDAAVPPESLGSYLRKFHALLERYHYQAALYGHFGQGCVHCRISFDLESQKGVQDYRHFVEDAADLVVAHGGSLSGEHGDGQSRAELLPRMFGPELVEAFAAFKGIWDPDGLMNPGKVSDPRPLDQNLRLGRPVGPGPATHFHFPDDDGSMTRATLRCVGVGNCRREAGGTMCPSYMVLKEEEHSTRGRAHLLYEMLEGKELDGWRDETVRESLDLCLACKGCKGDCPVNVDMATYKAEFLSHHYQGRLRPRVAYSMGLIAWWARIAAHVPGLANTLTQAPLLAGLSKRLAGIAPQRRMPTFAARTFKQQFFAGRSQTGPAVGTPILLWPDTFNNHLFPGTALAAAEVLRRGGYDVQVPRAPLCCGRPLYDFGMLTLARRWLLRILDELRTPLRQGLQVVVLEPSCLSVFRDEMHGLLPDDPDARRLRTQVCSLGELMAKNPERWKPVPIERRAVVHGHCHAKSLWGMGDERHALEGIGLDVHLVDSGCCGMAGSFGFEAGQKYEVSVQCGERALMPAVRGAGLDALVVADGFSCREQIRQAGNRLPLHLAEVAQIAVRGEGEALAPSWPERGHAPDPAQFARLALWKPGLVAAVSGLGLVLGLGLRWSPPRGRRWARRARVASGPRLGLLGAVALGAGIVTAAARQVRRLR
jgi:FAD/FMN-containing dehydrogenase/Fe-S oxidoreductase